MTGLSVARKAHDVSLTDTHSPQNKAIALELKHSLDAAFATTVHDLTAKDISVVMPTYSPVQGRLLSEFNRLGGNAYIAGGKEKTFAFRNVVQFGLTFDTTAYINMFPEGMSKKIVAAIPEQYLDNKKIALFAFIPPSESWAKHVSDRGLETTIVGTNEQNTRLFFENKGNLMHILREAGLSAHVIPTEVVNSGETENKLRAVYQRMKGSNGQVVVQSCVENYEPTRFCSSEQELVQCLSNKKGSFKISRFVTGNEGNLSFFVGNTIPAKEGLGVVKCNLPEGIDCGNPESLALIRSHAAANGINASEVFSVTGRSTLKVVGDRLLANELCDGVGNNIGHVYDDVISQQIADIGDRLGKLMGSCGKVGLAGADLIIERNGKVWINEINDRQQGPTDQMSADAEASGIPGLSRMAWVAHFADFSKPENLAVIRSLRDHATRIHAQYSKSSGSFYIKVFATHAQSYDQQVTASRDLPEGIYSVSNKNGVWTWTPAEDVQVRPVNLASGSLTVKISSGSLKKGDLPTSGAEMFRITGMASGQDSPFVIENGVSCLNPKWRPMIEQLYADCFGVDYIKKNPLYVEPKPVAKALKPVVAANQSTQQKTGYGLSPVLKFKPA